MLLGQRSVRHATRRTRPAATTPRETPQSQSSERRCISAIRVVELNFASWPHREFDVDLVVRTFFVAAWFEATVARLQRRPVDHDAVADSLARLTFDGLRLPPPDVTP